MEQDRDQDNDLFNFDNQPQKPVSQEDQPTIFTGGAQSYPAPPAYESAPAEPVQEYIPPPPPPAQLPPKTNRTWLIIAIVLVLLCCCCLALGLVTYYWLGDVILCQIDPTYCR